MVDLANLTEDAVEAKGCDDSGKEEGNQGCIIFKCETVGILTALLIDFFFFIMKEELEKEYAARQR